MKIMSYVFRRVPSSIKLRLEQKCTVVWRLFGMFGGPISPDCFGGFLDQITTRKKGTVIWPLVAMLDCFGGLFPMFFGGFLDQIKNYDQKKKVQSSGLLTPFATHVTFYCYYVCTENEEINLT
jgi:hypothetical protein